MLFSGLTEVSNISVSFPYVAGCEAHQQLGWTWYHLAELRSRTLKEITLDDITACGGQPVGDGQVQLGGNPWHQGPSLHCPQSPAQVTLAHAVGTLTQVFDQLKGSDVVAISEVELNARNRKENLFKTYHRS